METEAKEGRIKRRRRRRRWRWHKREGRNDRWLTRSLKRRAGRPWRRTCAHAFRPRHRCSRHLLLLIQHLSFHLLLPFPRPPYYYHCYHFLILFLLILKAELIIIIKRVFFRLMPLLFAVILLRARSTGNWDTFQSVMNIFLHLSLSLSLSLSVSYRFSLVSASLSSKWRTSVRRWWFDAIFLFKSPARLDE